MTLTRHSKQWKGQRSPGLKEPDSSASINRCRPSSRNRVPGLETRLLSGQCLDQNQTFPWNAHSAGI